MPWPLASLLCSLYHFSAGSQRNQQLSPAQLRIPAQFTEAQRDRRGLIRAGMLRIPACSFFPGRGWCWGHCQKRAGLAAPSIPGHGLAPPGRSGAAPSARLGTGAIQAQHTSLFQLLGYFLDLPNSLRQDENGDILKC